MPDVHLPPGIINLMCGRFSLSADGEDLAVYFDLEEVPVTGERFNIAPSQPIGVVYQDKEHDLRSWELMDWGMVPSWAKDPNKGPRPINARSETAAAKPTFRAAMKRRRCLIPAGGFYEWKRSGSAKQPYYFKMKKDPVFAMAGLWERWENDDGSEIISCTILTTEANEILKPIHDRMPVIIAHKDFKKWLDPMNETVKEVQPLLKPFPAQNMKSYPVSTKVNSPKNDDASLLEEVKEISKQKKKKSEDLLF